jgi:hypothetical protein
MARASSFRWFPFDPVLHDRAAEPARREAWIRDQYMHPLEHRHTVGDVQRWFRENGIEYVRSYPSTLLGQGSSEPLFDFAEDDWALENLIAQVSWAVDLWAEGGLFVVVGKKTTG